MVVHEKIKFFRQAKNWTQEEVAEKLGLSPNGYGSIERGETDICYRDLNKSPIYLSSSCLSYSILMRKPFLT